MPNPNIRTWLCLSWKSAASQGVALSPPLRYDGDMSTFTIEHFQTPSGEAAEKTSGNARHALEVAEKLGSGVTITAPDGRHFHVSDFRMAVDAGEFGVA